MNEAIALLSQQANWKLRTLLQTRRNFTVDEIMCLFKSRILSYIEYRTPAIYHACSTHLGQIDAILKRLLRTFGISEVEALMNFRLAPLQSRRDMGMLGVIHRSVLGDGPDQFAKYFVRKHGGATYHGREAGRQHSKQLITHRTGKFLDVLSHSLLGLVDIYNLLPEYIVSATTVSEFQKMLQQLIMKMAACNQEGWQQMYSPRNSLWNNHLRKLQGWCPEQPRAKNSEAVKPTGLENLFHLCQHGGLGN